MRDGLKVGDGHDAQFVTVIEAGRSPDAEIGYERPSQPLPEFFRRLGGFARAGVMAAAILAYPAMMVKGHHIQDTSLGLSPFSASWRSLEHHAAHRILHREVYEAGWSADRANWRPQARLTAMPAWQVSVASALSDFIRLEADLTELEGELDRDLDAAARLMQPTSDTQMQPRLKAALEALERFDDRSRRGDASAPEGPAAIQAKIGLIRQWARTSEAELASLLEVDKGWPASNASVDAFYTAKARAFVAAELLSAIEIEERAFFEDARLMGELNAALKLWRRASELKPLFVSNQPSDGLMGANHLASIGFFIDQAEAASARLDASIEASRAAAESTRGDFAMLSYTP